MDVSDRKGRRPCLAVEGRSGSHPDIQQGQNAARGACQRRTPPLRLRGASRERHRPAPPCGHTSSQEPGQALSSCRRDPPNQRTAARPPRAAAGQQDCRTALGTRRLWARSTYGGRGLRLRPRNGETENRAVHAPQQSQLPGRSLRFRRTARCACVRVCFCVHAYTLPKTCVILCKEYESRKHVLPVICSSMHVDLLGYSVHIIFHHAPQCVEGGHTGAKDVICALGGVW